MISERIRSVSTKAETIEICYKLKWIEYTIFFE